MTPEDLPFSQLKDEAIETIHQLINASKWQIDANAILRLGYFMAMLNGKGNNWVTLDDLRTGAIFVTKKGTYAAKSEYRYSNDPGSQWQCILLASGEFAHFPEKNRTLVREVKGEWSEDE